MFSGTGSILWFVFCDALNSLQLVVPAPATETWLNDWISHSLTPPPTEPLFPSTMDDDLDGPIEQLANLEHKVTLPEEDGEVQFCLSLSLSLII